jgi:hypothetical protein
MGGNMPKRYFVNEQTKGHIIADAKMGESKQEMLGEILREQGYSEVERDEYHRFVKNNPQE